jgi:hypothetical protein
MPAVGACDVCAKATCISCAIPIRGRLVCHDCLPTVLEDAPLAPPPPARLPLPGKGDFLAIAGFALIVVLSVFPWTRFGDNSGYLDAWSPHWSLAAVIGATVGLAFAIRSLRRPLDPRLVSAAYVGMGLLVALAAILHRRHPAGSPLATASGASRLALLFAAVAVLGGLLKAFSMMRWTRPSP